MKAAKRSWLKLDRYALFQLQREHRLKPTATLVLFDLVCAADYRNESWTGTLSEISYDLGCSTTTAGNAIKTLVAKNLVEIINPFGRNGSGCLKITAYCDLVLPTHTRRIPAQQITNTSRIADVTCDYGVSGGIEAVREKGYLPIGSAGLSLIEKYGSAAEKIAEEIPDEKPQEPPEEELDDNFF